MGLATPGLLNHFLGLEGLYVVDASIMPNIPAAHTNLSTFL